tara:strand:- start:118 stop:483 length:366 start_codon:yes stop_codon:yes gene_type:complete
MYQLMGLDMLLLSTKGRKTGELRQTPLLFIEEAGKYYCVASFGGNDRHPNWFLNILAEPRVQLTVKQKTLYAIATEISGQERERMWKKLAEYYPNFNSYQDSTTRIIPVIEFNPTKLDIPI